MAVGNYAGDLFGHGGSDAPVDGLASLGALLATAGVPGAEVAAEVLLAEFGTVAAVLAAESERLEQIIHPRGVALIGASRSTMLAALRPQHCQADIAVVDSTRRLLEYFQAKIACSFVEELHVLFLAKDLTVLREEMIARGSRDRVAMEAREIVRRALVLQASALLLAHNHPSGSIRPSLTDVQATKRLAISAALFDITVVDHVVVTREGAVSFAAEGLL